MNKLFLLISIIAVSSCIKSCKSAADSPKTYDQFVEGFDQRFEEIETEYESADAHRQLELDSIYESVELEMVEAQKSFIRAFPDSLRSVFLLYEIDWSFKSTDEFWSYIKLIDTSLHSNDYYVSLCKIVRQTEMVEIGMIAPDFEMNDTEGVSRRLSDAFKDSEYLLLDFWASNCSPCRLENPYIRKAYDTFHSKGFDVFGVSTDTRKESWLEAVEKDGLTWTNVCSLEPWSENSVVFTYALSQVSQNFLLDKTGKILGRNLRGEDLHTALSSLME